MRCSTNRTTPKKDSPWRNESTVVPNLCGTARELSSAGWAEVATARCDEACVGLLHRRSAEALELAILKAAQQLDLNSQGKVTVLVEKEGAFARKLHAVGFALRRPREGFSLVAEKLSSLSRKALFRARRLSGERAAMYRDERPPATGRTSMDFAHRDLVAGAALAVEQRRRHRRSRFFETSHDLSHGRGSTKDGSIFGQSRFGRTRRDRRDEAPTVPVTAGRCAPVAGFDACSVGTARSALRAALLPCTRPEASRRRAGLRPQR